MTGQTDWLSALAVLAAGVIVGVMIIYFLRRPKAENKRPRLSSARLGFVWGVASALAVVALGYFVTRPAQHSPVTLPAQPPAEDPLRALETNVQKQPDDLAMRTELARAYLERDNLMGVFEQTRFILAKSPDDSRALTYQAIVRMTMGDNEAAAEMLKHALEIDPNFLDAYVTTASLQTQAGKMKEADKTMAEAMKRHPQERERLQQVFDQMKAHRGVPTEAPKPEATPESAKPIRITLEISAATRARTGGSGIIWVIARPAGVAAGHPVAVKRIDPRSLPTTFEIASSDSMMGQPLPQTIRIEARLDSDGDVATKNPDDPYAVQDRVVAGSAIRMALQ